MSRSQHLRSLLEASMPADAREHAHRDSVLRLLRDNPEPFSREQFTPGHVTASAFILNPARDALLLILHGKLQLWLQPGGHVEPDDADVLRAVEREVREEVGLSALTLAHPGVFDIDVHDIPSRKDQPSHQHFDVRFLLSTEDTRAIAGSDAQAARWVSIADLLDADWQRSAAGRTFPSDESVLRAVRKLRGSA